MNKKGGKPMPFAKHKAIFIKKYGVKKWEALVELKKMWESVGEKKEVFIKKFGVEKLKAYFELVKMWDSIDGKKKPQPKKHMAKKQPEAWKFDMDQFKDQLNNLMQW